jgi:cyanophycinase
MNIVEKGHLILIGGSEDKVKNKDVLKEVILCNHAKKIVVIPTASKYYPNELGEKYVRAFMDLGAEQIDVLDIRTREEADLDSHFEKINSADCIFFTGGDQVRLAEILFETKLLYLIKQKYLHGTTIAGTSAGAAIAGNMMIFDGDEMGFMKGSVNHSAGFGFLEDITIDTHFLARGRISRLAQFLLRGYSHLGIGIAEDTCLIIYPDFKVKSVGASMVTFINSKNMIYTDYPETKIDEPFTSIGFQISFFAPGMEYDLRKLL